MLCRFFASWTSRPHSAVALRPRHLAHGAAFALHATHVAAPAPHDAMALRLRPRRSTVPTLRYPRCCVCVRAPSATTLYVVVPLCCILATSAAPQWARPRAPNQIDSHNGTASKLSLRAQKQKIGPCCNFFAIRDCYGSLQPQAGS